jgi:hypothetical protein
VGKSSFDKVKWGKKKKTAKQKKGANNRPQIKQSKK